MKKNKVVLSVNIERLKEIKLNPIFKETDKVVVTVNGADTGTILVNEKSQLVLQTFDGKEHKIILPK